MSEERFTRLALYPERHEAFLLGYPLYLTETEYAIVAFLSSLNGGSASRGTICELCGEESFNIHICNINKKATELSGRKLIVFDGKNYKITENI